VRAFLPPPYGVFSRPAPARRERWVPLWSHWGRDWEAKATPSSSDAYSATASWRQTSAALPAVLDAAGASGEPLVTVSQST
jgi:hypothetical protein